MKEIWIRHCWFWATIYDITTVIQYTIVKNSKIVQIGKDFPQVVLLKKPVPYFCLKQLSWKLENSEIRKSITNSKTLKFENSKLLVLLSFVAS